jgi:regulator of protease activity HflC (stomatin/prohibitin superfamily)
MQARYKDSPIEFLSVDVGDITYPKGVVDSVIAKFVTNEENERRDVELEIAQKQIEIGIAEARGIADAQKIIRTTLDPMFLQFEALRAIEEMASSKNTTFMLMPVGKSGNAPVILIPEGK